MAALPAKGIVTLDIGHRFADQPERLWRPHRQRRGLFGVKEPVQQVEDMGLGRHPGIERHGNRCEHSLFVMMQDQSQNLDHLAVTASMAHEMLLQLPEGLRQVEERRPVPEGARLALDDGQIMTPVINGPPRPVVGPVDDTLVFADDGALGDDQEAVGIDAQADRPVGEGGRYAIAVALQMHEAGRRDPLAIFDKAVERPACRHQAFHLIRPGIGNRADFGAVRDLVPERLAARLKPPVQGIEALGLRCRLPQAVPRIPYVLLDLPLLPACRRVTELGFKQIMADQGLEAGVDAPLLAAPDLVDGRAHVIVDAPARHPAQHPEGMIVGVEQHLVGLQQIGAHEESPAIGELEVGNLQLGAHAGDDRPVLAPVELERLARREGQGHEGTSSAQMLLTTIVLMPGPSKSRHTAVRTLVAEAHQIGMQLLDRPLLLAGTAHLPLQPERKPLGIRVQLARPFRHPELWFDRVRSQIFANGITG